jgi:hypothetical protein
MPVRGQAPLGKRIAGKQSLPARESGLVLQIDSNPVSLDWRGCFVRAAFQLALGS